MRSAPAVTVDGAGDAAGSGPGLATTAAALIALTAVRLVWLAVQRTDLYPDEAQYWFWAQAPAFGYYSKPPLLAWLIALTTGLFGDSEFAVRLAAPLLHATAALFVYGLAARLYDRRVGFWSALAYATLPGVSVSADLMSTDAALMPCWAAALYFFVRAREGGGRRWWLALGMAIGLGLLAKYAMAYWIVSALGLAVLDRAERRHLWPLLGAIAVGMVLLAPNLWWNYRNGFVSFLHLEDNAELGGHLVHPAALAEFVGAQFALFGPLFLAALGLIAATPRSLAGPRERLLAAFVLPTLAIVATVSLLSRAHANWAAPAYVSATVLVIAWALRRSWRALVIGAIALNLAAGAAVLGGDAALAAFRIRLPARYDPLHRLHGWRRLGERMSLILAQHPGFALLADDRELLAALIYYVHPHPLDAALWDPKRLVKNQWDLTNDLGKHLGEDYIVILRHPQASRIAGAFASVQPLGPLVLPVGPGMVRRYRLYAARHFLGYPRDRNRSAVEVSP